MPDLLLLPKDTQHSFSLEQLGSEIGYRIKLTFAPSIAIDWLTLRDFDAVVVDAAWDLPCLQRVAEATWHRHTKRLLLVYDIGTTLPQADRQQLLLLGAQLFTGADAVNQVKAALKIQRQLEAAPAKPMRVLVVEDLDSPRDVICAFVEKAGEAEVQGVASAAEALSTLEQDAAAFDCIITDINMPMVPGGKLIERIRAHKHLQHLPVIVLTAYGTADNLVACLKAGASGFLVKPPKKRDLLRELSRARRIRSGQLSPRLASNDEADSLRTVLVDWGFEP